MFRVLPSSAGAGKTHALVKHYLCLALATNEPSGYAHILALTFTNKAAHEMRERILRYLRSLSGDDGLNAALIDARDTVMSVTGISAAELRQRAHATLSHMLYHWPRFAVSTIDAFTRRVVMPFARDLRLDSELRMTTEEAWYRDRAVDRLLSEAGSDAGLDRLLIAICEELIEQERDWRADKPLRTLGLQLSKERSLVHLEKLRELGHAHFIALRTALRASTTAFRERIRALGRNALDAIVVEGLDDEDLAYGKGGPLGYIRALAAFNDWIDERKNTGKVLQSGKWASVKADAGTRAAIDRVAPILHDAISAVEHLRSNGELHRHALTCAVLRDLLPSAALHLLDERLEAIKREDGVAFFSDLVRKVAAIVQVEPAPFLYERLGERYRHFLIDEFQDTSSMQWLALLPLLTNALSGDGSALLVGDAKQAIYRWRNGEARQFVALPRLFEKATMAFGQEHEDILVRAHVAVEPLVVNHRSARTIIAFNNELFDALRGTLHEEHHRVYEGHAQTAVKELDGYVRMQCHDADDDTGAEEVEEAAPAAVRFCGEAVAEALADGFQRGDVAVLVRTKAQGRAVAAHLVGLGHDVVSPDGLSLGSDPGVQAVMAVFTWLQRPDDVSAALAVQHIARLTPSTTLVDPFLGRPPQACLRDWSNAHPSVGLKLPLLTLLHRIAEALGIDPAQDAFCMGLLNEAHLFAQEHGDMAASFIEHWDRVASSRAVGGTEGSTSIRVMTVHASKGLQFPVVIVPFADMWAGGRRDPVWIDPHTVIADLPAALIRTSKTIDALQLPEVETEERLSELDLMDLLYVAFTRPELRLYAGINGTRKSGLAAALREHLQLAPGLSFERGTREPPPPRRPVRESEGRTLAPATPRERLSLAVKLDAPEQWDPADPDPFRSHGRAVHAVLARVHTPVDLPSAVAVEAGAWGLSPDQRDELLARLTGLLALPDVRPFFAQGARVRTEATIIDANGHAHRPDRIVNDNTGTRVLDIKTGERSAHHREQVLGYASLLRQLGERDVSAHLLYLRDGILEDVLP